MNGYKGMDLETFQDLPVEEVAELVRASGPKVCTFPINGTRRWYLLEDDGRSDYTSLTAGRHIEIYRMLFAHGLDTLLAPVFGADLMERGPEYVAIAMDGLARLATGPDFLELYESCGVRVRFYGDYRKILGPTPHAGVIDLFDQATARTLKNDRCRLFFGVFASNAVAATAELSVRYHAEHGRVPDEQKLIEMYYGEQVGPASIFIGFDKFSVFDMPLIPTDETDLYFSVSPSLYLTERGLRAILYDHLYARRVPEPDYDEMPAEAVARMRDYYRLNSESIFGLGEIRDGLWYPSLQAGKQAGPGH